MKRSEEILTQEQHPAYVKVGFFRIAMLPLKVVGKNDAPSHAMSVTQARHAST